MLHTAFHFGHQATIGCIYKLLEYYILPTKGLKKNITHSYLPVIQDLWSSLPLRLAKQAYGHWCSLWWPVGLRYRLPSHKHTCTVIRCFHYTTFHSSTSLGGVTLMLHTDFHFGHQATIGCIHKLFWAPYACLFDYKINASSGVKRLLWVCLRNAILTLFTTPRE